ncbi:MAG: hypothetical protein DWH79_02755 [Planctomycetota bacterium]|nr:MAG: hypothetical protein DWH79_02755 [Planctomycetota bacterium]
MPDAHPGAAASLATSEAEAGEMGGVAAAPLAPYLPHGPGEFSHRRSLSAIHNPMEFTDG